MFTVSFFSPVSCSWMACPVPASFPSVHLNVPRSHTILLLRGCLSDPECPPQRWLSTCTCSCVSTFSCPVVGFPPSRDVPVLPGAGNTRTRGLIVLYLLFARFAGRCCCEPWKDNGAGKGKAYVSLRCGRHGAAIRSTCRLGLVRGTGTPRRLRVRVSS